MLGLERHTKFSICIRILHMLVIDWVHEGLWTYYGDFASELVLDLALLDCLGSMLLDELVKVFNTHCG